MYVCMCIYICIHVCMYVYTHTHTRTHICTHICTCMYVCCTNMFQLVVTAYFFARGVSCMRLREAYMHIRLHTHTHTHTHAHTHTHTHTCTKKPASLHFYHEFVTRAKNNQHAHENSVFLCVKKRVAYTRLDTHRNIHVSGTCTHRTGHTHAYGIWTPTLVFICMHMHDCDHRYILPEPESG
jgi:hypothetical protein